MLLVRAKKVPSARKKRGKRTIAGQDTPKKPPESPRDDSPADVATSGSLVGSGGVDGMDMDPFQIRRNPKASEPPPAIQPRLRLRRTTGSYKDGPAHLRTSQSRDDDGDDDSDVDYGSGSDEDAAAGLIDEGEGGGVGRSDHDDLGRRLQSREEEGGMAAADALGAISDEREEQLAEALQDALSDGRSAAGSVGGDLDAEGGGRDDESVGSIDSREQADPDAIAAAHGDPSSPPRGNWQEQGWTKHRNEAGSHFYWHSATEKSQWGTPQPEPGSKPKQQKKATSTKAHYSFPEKPADGRRLALGFDIETSGPKKQVDRVIGWGWGLWDLSTNQVLGEFESLINCDQKSTPWAFDIHKKHNNNGFGFFGTFQYHLGKALIQGGLKMWEADRANPAAADAGAGAGGAPVSPPTHPHFKPKRRQVSIKTPQSSKHELVNHKKGKQGTSEWQWRSRRRCVMCSYLGTNKRVWTECSGCKKPRCPAHFNGNHKGEKWSHDSMSAASKSPSAVGE